MRTTNSFGNRGAAIGCAAATQSSVFEIPAMIVSNDQDGSRWTHMSAVDQVERGLARIDPDVCVDVCAQWVVRKLSRWPLGIRLVCGQLAPTRLVPHPS